MDIVFHWNFLLELVTPINKSPNTTGTDAKLKRDSLAKDSAAQQLLTNYYNCRRGKCKVSITLVYNTPVLLG